MKRVVLVGMVLLGWSGLAAYWPTCPMCRKNKAVYGQKHCPACKQRCANAAREKSNIAAQVETPEGEFGGDWVDPITKQPIDRKNRIEALCGYAFGDPLPNAAQKIRNKTAVLGEGGGLCETVKLATPFRLCQQAKLYYTPKEHRLWNIVLFSEPQLKMDDASADAEVKGMCDAMKTKFGEKVVFTDLFFQTLHRIDVHPSFATRQNGMVSWTKEEVAKRGALKGPGGKQPTNVGYVFKLDYRDDYVRRMDKGVSAPVQVAPGGADAL